VSGEGHAEAKGMQMSAISNTATDEAAIRELVENWESKTLL